MKEESRAKTTGIITLVISILFLMWTLPLLLLSGGSVILEQGLKLAGSSFAIGHIDNAARGYLNMAILKPLWERGWIGVLGIICAFGIMRKEKHAWTLRLLWGSMLITNAVIQDVYDVIILHWSNACLQTYLFLVLGIIAVTSLLITPKAKTFIQ